MIRIKAGVRLSETMAIAVALRAAEALADEAGIDLVITSGIDGKHSSKSLHYSGRAFDFRRRHLSENDCIKLRDDLQNALGDDFDVVLELDHFHVEFDPKPVEPVA